MVVPAATFSLWVSAGADSDFVPSQTSTGYVLVTDTAIIAAVSGASV